MSYTPYSITFENAGLIKNKKPFLLMDNAFQNLDNAYLWRRSIKKREGIKLVGRLRRCFTTDVTLSTQANGASYTNADVLNDPSFNLRTNEPNAQIEQGSVQITVGAIVFTDVNSDGILTDGGTNTGTINYSTGELNLSFSPALGVDADVDVQLCYFPSLPVMGIPQREVAAINLEETLFFDTVYVYNFNGNHFASPSSTTWSGDDFNFFWGANYRGSDANERLFFVTNFASPLLSADNIIRYTPDAGTWTDFTPAVAGTAVTGENVGTVTNPWLTFNGNLLNTPIIPGSVTITVSNNGTNPDVRFKDQLGTYPNGTLIGSPNSNTGTIVYDTGAITLNFDPAFTANATVTATYQHAATYMFQARIIIPYYGRLLAFNTWEGATRGSSENFFNRCRFSQVGNPIQQDAWVATTFGKGGFIDAPINEAIVSAKFYKNTLIVCLERSTWQLRYVGEYGLPFLWERISSDFGSESTFSTILFDSGVLAVGDKAIVASSGNSVERIDLDVPDTVFDFHNQDNGKERVHGVRDFQKEIVFWTYSDGGLNRKFPNRTLLHNYRNSSWAIFRDNVTTFGTLASPTGVSWDAPISWDSNTSWDNLLQPEQPLIISGNQQGFVHFYQLQLDPETTSDHLVDFIEHESLYIKDITRSATAALELNIPDHNLEEGEIIYIDGLLFANTSTNTALTTSLNQKFYIVQERIDDDNIAIWEYDSDIDDYLETSGNIIGFTPATGTGTYIGGGVVALLPKMDIITKDFNPITTQKVKSSYCDFQTDATPNAEVSIQIYVDSSIGDAANLPVYNPNMQTNLGQTGYITNITQANPAVVTSRNHGLLNGRIVTFGNINGMTALNGLNGTVTYLTKDTFSVNIDTSGFGAYTNSGQWWTQDLNPYYIPGSNYAWHRFYSNVHGQYITYQITYNDFLMNNPTTHKSDFQMNAMILYVRPAGYLI